MNKKNLLFKLTSIMVCFVFLFHNLTYAQAPNYPTLRPPSTGIEKPTDEEVVNAKRVSGHSRVDKTLIFLIGALAVAVSPILISEIYRAKDKATWPAKIEYIERLTDKRDIHTLMKMVRGAYLFPDEQYYIDGRFIYKAAEDLVSIAPDEKETVLALMDALRLRFAGKHMVWDSRSSTFKQSEFYFHELILNLFDRVKDTAIKAAEDELIALALNSKDDIFIRKVATKLLFDRVYKKIPDTKERTDKQNELIKQMTMQQIFDKVNQEIEKLGRTKWQPIQSHLLKSSSAGETTKVGGFATIYTGKKRFELGLSELGLSEEASTDLRNFAKELNRYIVTPQVLATKIKSSAWKDTIIAGLDIGEISGDHPVLVLVKSKGLYRMVLVSETYAPDRYHQPYLVTSIDNIKKLESFATLDNIYTFAPEDTRRTRKQALAAIKEYIEQLKGEALIVHQPTRGELNEIYAAMKKNLGRFGKEKLSYNQLPADVTTYQQLFDMLKVAASGIRHEELLGEQKPLYQNPEIIGGVDQKKTAYYTYNRCFASEKDNHFATGLGLSFDIIAIPPKLIGNQPVQVRCPYRNPMKTTEIYQTISGTAWCLLQEHSIEIAKKWGLESVINDVFLIMAKPGEPVIVPAGWSLTIINPDPTEALVMGKWRIFSTPAYPYRSISGVSSILSRPAYLTTMDLFGNVTFEPNYEYVATYGNVPGFLFAEPKEVPDLGLIRGRPMYDILEDKIEFARMAYFLKNGSFELREYELDVLRERLKKLRKEPLRVLRLGELPRFVCAPQKFVEDFGKPIIVNNITVKSSSAGLANLVNLKVAGGINWTKELGIVNEGTADSLWSVRNKFKEYYLGAPDLKGYMHQVNNKEAYRLVPLIAGPFKHKKQELFLVLVEDEGLIKAVALSLERFPGFYSITPKEPSKFIELLSPFSSHLESLRAKQVLQNYLEQLGKQVSVVGKSSSAGTADSVQTIDIEAETVNIETEANKILTCYISPRLEQACSEKPGLETELKRVLMHLEKAPSSTPDDLTRLGLTMLDISSLTPYGKIRPYYSSILAYTIKNKEGNLTFALFPHMKEDVHPDQFDDERWIWLSHIRKIALVKKISFPPTFWPNRMVEIDDLIFEVDWEALKAMEQNNPKLNKDLFFLKNAVEFGKPIAEEMVESGTGVIDPFVVLLDEKRMPWTRVYIALAKTYHTYLPILVQLSNDFVEFAVITNMTLANVDKIKERLLQQYGRAPRSWKEFRAQLRVTETTTKPSSAGTETIADKIMFSTVESSVTKISPTTVTVADSLTRTRKAILSLDAAA